MSVQTAEDAALLWARLAVTSPPAADCTIVDSCADGRNVTQRIKTPDDGREHREKSKDHLLDRADLPERLAGDLGAHRFAPSAIPASRVGQPAEHPCPRIVGAYERR